MSGRHRTGGPVSCPVIRWPVPATADAVEPRPERSTAVLLRDVRPEDLDEFFLHQQDEQANLMSAFAPRNPRDRGVFDYHWAHLLGDEDTVVRTIEHEGRAVGALVCTQQDGVGELSFWTAQDYWGLGLTTAAMVQSAFTAPHVTEFLQVDVTETMELLAELKASREFRDVKLTPMTLAAKACLVAMERTPDVNARWDEAAGTIVQQNFVNLGFAAATPRGLMVPNVKDAQAMSLRELADAIRDLTGLAREGRLSPADLAGGTFTLTNVGVFGVDAGTPIINPGEGAIIAIGQVRRMPWEHRGEIALRDVMTLSLSFDHRFVDGEQGSRFLADVGAILRRPGLTLTMV